MGMIAIGFIICIASTGRGVPGVMYFGIFVAVVGKCSCSISECLFALANPNVRHLPCVPWKRHLAQRQHGWRLQASCWYGNLYRTR